MPHPILHTHTHKENVIHSVFYNKKSQWRTFGEEKFSLGNTAPPYSSMVARIWASSSGNEYRAAELAVASSSLSESWSSSKVLFGGLMESFNVEANCQRRCTHKFSDPVGTKTPSASRYDLNSSGRSITVDFIDKVENVGNQLEN